MVDASTIVRRGAPITLGVISLFSFIIAIIASVLTHNYNTKEDAKHSDSSIKGRVRFFLFVGWFSFIFATAYVVAFLTGIGGVFTSIVSHGIFLFLEFVFFLSASASLIAALGGGQNCSNSSIKYCSANEALVAFGFINWIISFFLLAVVGAVAVGAFRGNGSFKEAFGGSRA